MSYEEFKGGNRAVIDRNGETLFCLHETVIVAELADRAIQISTGGWDTKTTWKYIGIALRCLGKSITFRKERLTGQRFVLYNGNEVPFKDNVIIGRPAGWDITLTRIDNDYCNCPRWVCHFLTLLTEREKNKIGMDGKYEIALARAKKIGGRKFHNKQFGGGVVFADYADEDELKAKIANKVDFDERMGD